jgi:phenol 2-monooxygenase
VKVIYQQDHRGIDINAVPSVFKPEVGPFRLTNLEKVYGTDPNADIFELRGLDRGGVVVVVRPDQYVANVLPLTATAELGAFFTPLLPARQPAPLQSEPLQSDGSGLVAHLV